MSIISQFQKQIKTSMLQKHHFKFHTKKKESKKMQLLHPLDWGQLKSIVDINKYLLTFYLRGDEHVPVVDKLQFDLRNKK